MNANLGQAENVTACFQFTSNSIQLAASFEILSHWSNSENFALSYYWLGASTKYPSRMSRGLDSFNFPFSKVPNVIGDSIKQIKFDNTRYITEVSRSSEPKETILALKNQLQSIKSVHDFNSIKHDEILPGGALANSFVYETGRRDFDLRRDERIISLLLDSYLSVYFFVKSEILDNGIERALIYNGRFLHERATWDACKSVGIDAFLFETTRNRYHLRKNQGFHDRVINQKLMKDLWQSTSLELSKNELTEIGSRYFTELESSRNRFYKKEESYNSKNKAAGHFVFFSNSDDEAVGFWDSWTEPFMDQVSLIENLQRFFDSRKREHLYIRLHPNLSSKSNEEKMRWEKLKSSEYSTVINPDEHVSSYVLLKAAKGVISYGSTIGMEAAFHSIPSAILADCWYDELDVADKLANLSEVFQWIGNVELNFNDELLAQRKDRSLIRGLWLELSGNVFENCSMRELGWGAWEVLTFKDAKIVRSKLSVAVSILVNRIKRRVRGLEA